MQVLLLVRAILGYEDLIIRYGLVLHPFLVVSE